MTELWADLLGTCAAVGWKIAVENPLGVNLSELGAQNRFLKLANEWFSDPLSLPPKAVTEAVELARESGKNVRKKPEELYDNSFVLNLEKSGFLKELWEPKSTNARLEVRIFLPVLMPP